MTALMHACSMGHIEIVRVLLDAGADTNFRDTSDKTARLHALSTPHFEIARLLAGS